MQDHSALPNMLTRSRSAATSGSSVPLAAKGSLVPRQWQRPSQAPGRLMPLMRAQDLGAKGDLVQIVWEARSRPGCQGPQRKCAGYLSTTSWKLKLSDSRKNRVIREMEMRKKK